MRIVFIFAFFLLSCSHWLIETKTRIQVENLTSGVISDFGIVSEYGQRMVFVPGNIESNKKSGVYEVEWVGEFNFGVYVGGNWESLGVHKLKGGSLLARVMEKDGKFEMELR